MCTRLNARFDDVEISCIVVSVKEHVAVSKSDSIIGVSSDIV